MASSSAQASTALPAKTPKVSSEDIISQKTDLCISNAIVKAGLGFGSGVLLSVILFRRRAFPVWLGTGFGLGSAWTDCERSFNPVAIPGVRVLPSPHSAAAPSAGEPSVYERLSDKTATLFDKGKAVAQEATEKGKEKAKEVEEKEDCTACRLVGFATCSTLAGFCLSEAYRIRTATSNSSFQPPRGSPRARIYTLVAIGLGSGVAGVYRLVN